MMDPSYLLMPLIAWLVAGATKFGVNLARHGRDAFSGIGYGGMPSNHSAIVASVATLIALREGVDHPAFGAAMGVLTIVVLDAGGLRRHIGRQAAELNRLLRQRHLPLLRETIGHRRVEIIAGLIVGAITAVIFDGLMSRIV